MAGEISTAGVVIKYAPEATVNVRPTTGYKTKATGATLDINQYVTGASGLSADYEMYDVTTLSDILRHRFIKGLLGNDGNISLSCNINPTSRSDWNAIVTEFEALTGGLGMWFEFTLPGDTQSFFVRGEPTMMLFPDIETAQAVQGAVSIIENDSAAWEAKST